MKKLILTVFAVVLCLSLSAWAQKVVTQQVQDGVFTPGPSQCDDDGSLADNCGWETQPAFTGWTTSGDRGFTGVCSPAPPCPAGGTPPFVHSGNWALVTGPVGGFGCEEQNVPTDPESLYDLSFWLRHDGGNDNRFQVSWNGAVIYDQTNMPGFPYTSSDSLPVGDTSVFIGLTPSDGDATNLKFCFIQVPAWFYFDDVDVLAE